jgi:hypothetical protein
MSRLQWRLVFVAFGLGAFVPLLWGILAFVYFTAPEGAFSQAFWKAVYLTCPFWCIEGYKSYFLTPFLNGLTYAAIAATILCVFKIVHKSEAR